MIKTLIFDFGDVFINLNKQATAQKMNERFGSFVLTPQIENTNRLYEKGEISSKEFVSFYMKHFKTKNTTDIIEAWNAILLDFPEHRLEFIASLSEEKKYKLILLSNTNEIHIDWIKKHIVFFERFKSCFDAFYLSHLIKLRKPNTDIYQFVLNENNLNPNECLFIDDTPENTLAASRLGIQTWTINPKTEDVTQLFDIKNNVF